MCATVCPSGALTYTTREEIERTRQGVPINEWRFGSEVVRTKVYVMVPPETSRVEVDLVQISVDGMKNAPRPGEAESKPPTDPYDVAALLGEV
jgi:ferredoxin